jgi:hypothetical protein
VGKNEEKTGLGPLPIDRGKPGAYSFGEGKKWVPFSTASHGRQDGMIMQGEA